MSRHQSTVVPGDDSVLAVSRPGQGQPTWTGIILVLVSTAIFGATPAVITFLRDGMPLVDVITYRGLLAGALLLVLSLAVDRAMVRRGGRRLDRRRHRWFHRHAGLVIGVTVYAPQLLLFYSAFDYIGTSLSVALGYIYPTIVIFLVAARAKLRPSRGELGVAVMALAGILALTNPGSDPIDLAGVALVFMASVLYALYVVIAGDLVADLPPLRVGGQVSGGVGIAVGGYGIFSGSIGMPVGAAAWGGLVLQAVMLVCAVATYYLGLVRLGASTTSLVDCAQPLFALMAGGWLLGERLVPLQLLGVVLVTLAVAMTSILARRAPAVIPYADPP